MTQLDMETDFNKKILPQLHSDVSMINSHLSLLHHVVATWHQHILMSKMWWPLLNTIVPK